MSAPSSPPSECSTLECPEFVADPNVVKMLVNIITTRHGQPTDMGRKSTLHNLRHIVKGMCFATRVAFAPRAADMSRHRYVNALEGSAEGSTLPSAQQVHAATCVNEFPCIKKTRNLLEELAYLRFSILGEVRVQGYAHPYMTSIINRSMRFRRMIRIIC
ncbi:hypothetical protein C8R48DRAFT_673465 [Suillus tomentosus]|nr:hypothetical protein C8R48DRAFT_673465 [Suillus tomentosus]